MLDRDLQAAGFVVPKRHLLRADQGLIWAGEPAGLPASDPLQEATLTLRKQMLDLLVV